MHQTALLLRITVDGLLLFMLPCFLQSQGLSHCFERAKEGGLADVMVIEPISSSSLECMAAGKEILCPHSAATPAIHPMHGTGWGGGGCLHRSAVLHHVEMDLGSMVLTAAQSPWLKGTAM